MYGPVLHGTTFRLRAPRVSDSELMIEWLADPEVTARLRIRFPPSVEGEREWVQRMATDPNSIFWVIEHEQRVVGSTGLHDIDWANQRAGTGTLIGDKRVWGRGIAREMMQLRADFAFTQLPLRKLKSSYLEGNEASRRAQEAAGYREVGRLHEEHFRDGRWMDEIQTELLRSDWERRRAGAGPPLPRQRSGPTGTPT